VKGASGEVNVSIEENGGSIAEGFIQGGGETFAARVALRSRETDGYVYNAYLMKTRVRLMSLEAG
jgi:hypothetical protein